MTTVTQQETTVEEYWDWLAVALFVLITVDMLTTMYAAWAVGAAAESNPVMRWALVAGVPTVVVINLAATVVAAGGFHFLMQWFERSREPYHRFWAFGIQAWLGLLIATGLFVFANNLIVILHGQSLFPLG